MREMKDRREQAKIATSAETWGPSCGTETMALSMARGCEGLLKGPRRFVRRAALWLLKKSCFVSRPARHAGGGSGRSEWHSRAG